MPPTPRAASREREPVGMAGTSTFSRLPSRMIEPLPNCLSIWARADSIAFALSPLSSAIAGAPYRDADGPPTDWTDARRGRCRGRSDDDENPAKVRAIGRGGRTPQPTTCSGRSRPRGRLLSWNRMTLVALLAAAAATLNVPFVPQEKDTCGAAALAMVLSYWGQPVPHDEIAAALLKKELRGIPGSDLARFARERGLT